MPPPNEQRPLSGAPSTGLDQKPELGNEDTRRANLLAAPTLGAIRRRAGHTDDPSGWVCAEAKVALAVELVQEAQRCALFDRLDGVMQFVAAGASPDQIVRRIERFVDDYHGRAHQTVHHDERLREAAA